MSRDTSAPAGTIADGAGWLDAALGGHPIPPLLIAVGLAGGDVLDALEDRAPDTRVLALEPDPVTANAFLARRDWSRWRETGRLHYLVGPDYAGADQAWRLFPAAPDGYRLIVHPAIARNPDVVNALQAVKRIVFGVKANAEAKRRFAPRYLANVIRNVPAIVAGHDVRALADVFRGVPAVIAAAGPSLDTALDGLRDARGRAVLIAADTALRPLLNAGIAPHLVVGADPGAANARHFQALPDAPDTWLVSESALDPSAASIFDGRTFWFRLARHHPWPWMHELGIDVGHVEMWGSVLTAAFQVACLAGCDPIVITGADLAFTDGHPYCRGTTYELDWASATARGRTLEEVWAAKISRRAVCRVPDLRGGETMTTGSMQSFRDWMLAAARRSGRRVINATGAGILAGDGIEQLSLLTALTAAHTIRPLSTVARGQASSVAASDLVSRLRDVREALKSPGASAPVADWAAFTGDGFNPTVLDSAVQDAVGALEGIDNPAPAARVIDWSSPGASTPDLLTRLPEALAGFRAALASTSSTPGVTNPSPLECQRHENGAGDRLTSLVETFDLLRKICEDVRLAGDLSLAVNPSRIGLLPVSGLYAWPDTLKWRVALFEARIHREWPSSEPPESAFLARPVRLRDRPPAPGQAPVAPSARVNATQASALLALEWLRVASGLPHGVSAGVQRAITQSIAATAHSASATSKTTEADAAIVLDIRNASSADGVTLSIPVAEAAFARVLTGALGEPGSDSYELASTATGPFRISIDMQPAIPEGLRSGPVVTRSKRERITPRVLMDEGVPPALVAYKSADGVVCVPFQRNESLIVRADGSVRTYDRWPRPIVNALPLGDHGALAWGDGLSEWPDGAGPGYVMYKHDRDSRIELQELPVRPTVGLWWQGRLYWNCHPRRVEGWTGLVSWAPGESPVLEIPDLPATIGMHGDQEGLTFELGGGPLQSGRWQRRFDRRGWTWRPGTELRPFQLGSYGAASARVVSDPWTATAHPEADLLRFESAAGDGTSMTCYYPYGLAWIGESLLVSTMQQDLLLFENLSARLR